MTDFSHRYGNWAIITGASGGLGEGFAHAVAARGINPILVARRADELERVASDVTQAFGVECLVFPVDLAEPDFADRLKEFCAGRDVGLVIGNAAYNPAGAFLDMSCETLMRMLDVNDRANVLLAQAFLPALKERGKGGFLMVGSVEGFMGVPWSAAYSASKAYILSFGEALWGECEELGVDVLVLAAGAIDTPLFATRDVGSHKVKAMDPRKMADIALDNMRNGPFVVPDKRDALSYRILRRMPRRWAVRTIGKAVREMVEATVKRNGGKVM